MRIGIVEYLGLWNPSALQDAPERRYELLTRERFALVSYFFLLSLFLGDFVLILLFPGSAAYFSVWFGPIFAVLGAQLVYFRNEHAQIWADWGGPQARVFAFVGVFFLIIGLYFAFGVSFA